MKNTRRAAAAWMTMSLAVSTVLGNTAWGDVLQETGKNRCVHVHTAECYGDADETATMSQTGELEPTECTHVCSVESGCILDAENQENNDADAWEVGTPSNADQKDTEDGGVVSVSTPSNAEDTTINPGGTVTPAVQTKILSWSWFDPEENLLDGRLELTGITEEAQPSFTEVTEYLPQAIIAQVGKGEDWEEKNLQITNWVCTEYVQDEEGRWPLEGTYEFKAELEEGYELADGVDALVVEVSVVGDQAAMTGAVYPIITVKTMDGKDNGLYGSDAEGYTGFLTTANISGLKYQTLSGDNYILTLTGTTVKDIWIERGNWTVELNGENVIGRAARSFYVGGSANVTIKRGNNGGTLDVTALANDITASAISVDRDAVLTIEGGTIKATADYNASGTGRSGAIYVAGTLEIKGGEIVTKAEGRKNIMIDNNSSVFKMSGGTLEATGGRSNVIENNGTFQLSGGTITTKSTTNGTGFMQLWGTTTIGDQGVLDVDKLQVSNGGTITIEEGGKITTGGTKIESGSLINKGEFVSNGAFEMDDSSGTFTNEGKISGNGSVPDSAKLPPKGMVSYDRTVFAGYDGSIIDVETLAKVVKSMEAGPLQYSLVDYEEGGVKGEGTITEDGKLTVTKAGIFKVKVNTKENGIYKSGDDPENGNIVYIILTVGQSEESKNWNLIVNAIDKVYDGKEEVPAIITASNIPQNVKVSYQYQLARKDTELSEENWDSSLTVKDVADSGKYVYVRVVTDNYKPKRFVSELPVKIDPCDLSKVTVTLDNNTFTYNDSVLIPTVTAKNDAEIVLEKGKDYTISYTDGKNEVLEPTDAGSYTVKLTAVPNGNYSGSTESKFTIEKCKLKAYMIGGQLDKIYDGTTNIAEGQKVIVELWDDSVRANLQDIRPDQVEYAYRSADVGEHYIDATVITVAGDKVDNYEVVRRTSSLLGVIKPRDFESMTVSAAPLTYNGTEQQPKINASVETGLEKVSPDATFTYSKDGVNYQSEIPGFTEAGTYLVYVKASMANFNDETKTVAVTVQKAAAPTVSAMSESYSYKETGERQVALPGLPENCGTIGTITAQIISDEGQILDRAAVDGMNLVLRLKGSSKNMVGKTAQVVVKVETKNYEDIQIPVIVTLTADSSDSNSNNNSGNNSGNNGSSNGNSNGGNNSGSNGGSSGSDRDRSDRDDSNAGVVKVSPGQSGKVTKDSQKGYRSDEQGVITGANNQAVNDGYSHWMKDAKGWWLRYSDGTWPMGRAGAYHWEKINGRWWAFGADGYLSTGWIYDTIYQGWFYMDENQGMLTGWQFINGKWYYLNPNSDGTAGIMYTKRRTPDGWYVKEDGSWDEEAGR